MKWERARVGEVMVARVITVGPRDTLEEVVEAMVRSNISGVVVADAEGRGPGDYIPLRPPDKGDGGSWALAGDRC